MGLLFNGEILLLSKVFLMDAFEITKAAFSQYNLPGKIELVKQYGQCIYREEQPDKMFYVFRLSDFHVLAFGPLNSDNLTHTELVVTDSLLKLYIR